MVFAKHHASRSRLFRRGGRKHIVLRLRHRLARKDTAVTATPVTADTTPVDTDPADTTRQSTRSRPNCH